MLMPDNIHPELSLYYNGAVILSELGKKPKQAILDLYSSIRDKHDMSFSLFVLSLDWLYLIDAAAIDDKGVVRKCL